MTVAKHDSRSVKQIVMAALRDFNISTDQIVAAVVDNAANMTHAIDLMNEEQDDLDEMDEEQDDVDEMDDQVHGDDELDDNDDDDDAELLEIVSSEEEVKISHMRCAAHTLQLGIRDALKKPRTAPFVAKIRNLATQLRAPHADAILKRRCKKGMLVDMPTRWGSTYLMIQRLVEIQDVVKDFPAREFQLTEYEWAEVTLLAEVLKAPYDATLRLQAENLTAGDFFKAWRELIFHMEQRGGVLADDIATALKARESKLLDNDIVLASIWIDARVRILLNDEQKQRAIKAVKGIHCRMHKLARTKSIPTGSPKLMRIEAPNSDPVASTSISVTSTSNPVPSNSFEEYLNSLSAAAEVEKQTASPDIDAAITTIESLGRLQGDSVWDIINAYPESIQPVCSVLSALPTTQVSVERVFSHLKLILRENRAKMNADCVEGIVFLRTNRLV